MSHRRASHAGSWYTDDPHKLKEELEGWINDSSIGNEETYPQLKALIAPHAGYRYSGPTTAYAYRHITPDTVKRIFFLGPSHHYYLRGCAVSAAKKYKTPLGDMTVDQQVSESLINTGKFEIMSIDVDEDEHSIEMHLPFAMMSMKGKDFTIVPILVGSTTSNLEREYGKILLPYFQDDTNLFIISSDFCHWGERFRYQPYDETHGEIHEYIYQLDSEAMKIIETQQLSVFEEYLETKKNTICGRHPILILLNILTLLETQYTVKFIKYAQSSKCKTLKDSSVSYASGIIFENKN